jgi:4-amino-4-deoxy-L-arabinose transferase-like glycosyltransferase
VNRWRSLSFGTRIYLLALIVRLIPVLLSINLPIGLDDMFQYDMLARSIASGQGFRWYAQEDLDLIRSYFDLEFVAGDYDPRGVLSSFRAPGYPSFLALIYSVSGLAKRFFAARLTQAFLGATTVPIVYALAFRFFPGKKKVAVLAAYFLALYPMLVIYPLALATENLFIPLIFGALLLLLHATESASARGYLLAGALFGAATLTRSVIFAFVGLAMLWLWFFVKSKRGTILFGIAVIALVLPWTLRNSLLYKQFTFVENSLGYNLHMGYHPEGSGTFQYGISLELFPYLDDGQRNELGVQAGLEFIRQDPARIPQLMINKLGYFFSLERRALSYFYSNGFFGPIPNPALASLFVLFTLPFALLSSLSAASLALMRWTKERLLLLLLILGYLMPHMMLLAEPRFHIALVPALSILASYAWIDRKVLWSKASQNKGRLAIMLVLIGLLWLNWGVELWRDADKLALLFGPDGYRAGFSY